jgi:hypothetical protein
MRRGEAMALLSPEPRAKLGVASSNVRGGFFPNIGSTGSDTGRYQGAIAVKAVPFPNVCPSISVFFAGPLAAGDGFASRALYQLTA